MATSPETLEWNLSPYTSLTKGVSWTGQINSPAQVTGNIDPNPNNVFTIVSISSYAIIRTPPGGGGGKFPTVATPLNPHGRAIASGNLGVVPKVMNRVGGAGTLVVGINEEVVVEVSADASKGTLTQGQNETIGKLNILGLPNPVSVPLVLDICQATTNILWTAAIGTSNPSSYILVISKKQVQDGIFLTPTTIDYGVGDTSTLTLAPPKASISASNPLTFWLQQWGGILDSGLDSEGGYTPVYPNSGVITTDRQCQ